MYLKYRITILIIFILLSLLNVRSQENECQICSLVSSHVNLFLLENNSSINNKYLALDYVRDLCYHYDKEILIFQNKCIPFVKKAGLQIIEKFINGQTDYLMICIELNYCG